MGILSLILLGYISLNTTTEIRECKLDNGGKIIGTMCEYEDINQPLLLIPFNVLLFGGVCVMLRGIFKY